MKNFLILRTYCYITELLQITVLILICIYGYFECNQFKMPTIYISFDNIEHYIDNNKVYDERFATLSISLEDEQRELKDRVPDIETFLEETEIKCEGLQHFIERAKRITRLSELTPELVHEFIERIVVSKPEKISGKRHQTIDIYYHGAGIIKMLSAEEMEGAYQQHISKQHKAKTA